MPIGAFQDTREKLAEAMANYMSAIREIEQFKEAMGDGPIVPASESHMIAAMALQDVGLSPTEQNFDDFRKLFEELS
jgi:hypothetical protein